ncbi:hypothetical protein GMRT_12228 [Giardia muris]|uniref:Uncharacterized protein n=1 Tax=Giardia muris TaxID=5742 RepID=A0A4Z1T4M4_GIAMU|nr:hypothetical protein GMRT_12228 [Giardia muris]|eukprot:TNJ30618.1 hypothetical protein GMRT_12228 [Giardia muris]
MFSSDAFIIALNSKVPSTVLRALEQLPSYVIFHPQEADLVMDSLYELYIISEGNIINSIICCIRKIITYFSDQTKIFNILLPKVLKILLSTTTHPVNDVILYAVQSIRPLICFSPDAVFEAMCSFMDRYQSSDEIRSSPKLSILALLPYFYALPSKGESRQLRQDRASERMLTQVTTMLNSIIDDVTFIEGIAPITDGVLSLCEHYSPIFLSNISRYFEQNFEKFQKELLQIPSRTDCFGNVLRTRLKSGDFIITYTNEERLAYIVSLANRANFEKLLETFFLKLFGPTEDAVYYRTERGYEELLSILQCRPQDAHNNPRLEALVTSVGTANPDLLMSIIQSLAAIVTIHPIHIKSYVLFCALLLLGPDLTAIARDTIMETMVYIVINLQLRLTTTLDSTPTTEAVLRKHHMWDLNQRVLTSILALLDRASGITHAAEMMAGREPVREGINAIVILHVVRILGTIPTFERLGYSLQNLTPAFIRTTLELLEQTVMTICTVPPELVTMLTKMSEESDPRPQLLPNCSLITYMSGATITKSTKSLLVELVVQIGGFLEYAKLVDDGEMITDCLKSLLAFTLTPNHALARLMAFVILDSKKDIIKRRISSMVYHGLFDPSWRVRLEVWKILARDNFLGLIESYEHSVPENLLLDQQNFNMNRDCLTNLPISVILWCFDSVAVVRETCVKEFDDYYEEYFKRRSPLRTPPPTKSSPLVHEYLTEPCGKMHMLVNKRLLNMCDTLLAATRYYYRTIGVEILAFCYRVLTSIRDALGGPKKGANRPGKDYAALHDSIRRVIELFRLTAQTDCRNVRIALIISLADRHDDEALAEVVETLRRDPALKGEIARYFRPAPAGKQ